MKPQRQVEGGISSLPAGRPIARRVLCWLQSLTASAWMDGWMLAKSRDTSMPLLTLHQPRPDDSHVTKPCHSHIAFLPRSLGCSITISFFGSVARPAGDLLRPGAVLWPLVCDPKPPPQTQYRCRRGPRLDAF